MTITQGQLTNYLNQFTANWGHPHRVPSAPEARGTSDRLIANRLLSSGDFQALTLATIFSSVSDGFIEDAVIAITPPLYAEDTVMLIAALKIAVRDQQQITRARVSVAGIGAMILALIIRSAIKSHHQKIR